MNYYDDYEDYYEPSEFDEKVKELKNFLRGSVKEEIQSEIEKLKKENEKLQEIKSNWLRLEDEYKAKQRELERQIQECKRNASKKRLDELFEETGMNVMLYQPDYENVYRPKCNKCDADRYVHFSSPSGKDHKEECDCAKRFQKYSPRVYYLTEFRKGANYSGFSKPMNFWYTKYKDYSEDYDGYTYRSNDLEKAVYNGESFEDLLQRYGVYSYGLYFRTEKECQGYCNWLNEKNGVTPNMGER